MVANANIFQGQDTYGANIQVAVSESGKFFYRVFRYNGYAKAWSKWESVGRDIAVYTNSYGKPAIKWGWNEFIGYQNPRIRLPK